MDHRDKKLSKKMYLNIKLRYKNVEFFSEFWIINRHTRDPSF